MHAFHPHSSPVRSPDAGGEAELSEMLGSVVFARRCDPELWEEVFGAFCSRFCSEFADWWPDDAPLRPARVAVAEMLAKGGIAKPQVVVGCRAGHPRELLRCLVEAIGGLARRPTDGSRTDSRYCDALQTVLKALRVACRSRHNQAALLALNLGEEMRRPIDLLAAQLSSERRQSHPHVGELSAHHQGDGNGVVPPRWLEPILAGYLEVLSDLSRSTWTKESDVRLSPSRTLSPLTARRLAVWVSDGREPSRLFNAALDALLLYLECLTPEDDSSRSGIVVDLLKLLPTVDADPAVAVDPVAVLTAVGCCIRCVAMGIRRREGKAEKSPLFERHATAAGIRTGFLGEREGEVPLHLAAFGLPAPYSSPPLHVSLRPTFLPALPLNA